MSLVAVAFTSIILGSRHASGTNTNLQQSAGRNRNRNSHITHRPRNLSQLRGGAKSDRIHSSARGGDQDLRDEDLDEYIDFLLAYADDKATESDNPLFRGTEPNQIEEEQEEGDQEHLEEEEEDSQEYLEEDLGVKPLVDDVNDDQQIDEMVETLVALVDDADVDDDLELENIEDDTTKTEIQTEELAEDIEMTAASSLVEEVEVAQDISPEEMPAEIVEEGTELVAAVSVEEEEIVEEVSAEFVAEAASDTGVEEGIELAAVVSVEEEEIVEEVSAKFLAEEASDTGVEEDTELAAAVSVEEEESVEEVSAEFVVEAMSDTGVEEDIDLAITDSSLEEVESAEAVSTETVTDDIPVAVMEDEMEGLQETVEDTTSFVEIHTPVDDTITEDTMPETPVVEMIDDEEKILSQSVDTIDGEESEEQKENESFFLGSSAVENMPVPLNEDQASSGASPSNATSTEEETKRVPLFTSLMRKIGLRKDEPELVDETPVDVPEQIKEIVDAEESVEADEKVSVAIESTDVIEEPTVSNSESEPQLLLSEEDIDTEGIQEVVLNASDASEEPTITVIEIDRESSVSDDVDVVEEGKDTVEDEVLPETETMETTEPIVLTSADEASDEQVTARVASLAKQYYQGAWGSVKDLWSKKRWLRKETEDDDSPQERDYMKIYEKYYAANQEALGVDANSSTEKQNRISNAFLRPWGTVSKFLKPNESNGIKSEAISTANYYSIGIQGFVAVDTIADASSQADFHDERVNIIEANVVNAELEVDEEVIVEEEVDSGVVGEALNTEETSELVKDLDLKVDDDVTLEEEEEEASVVPETGVETESEVLNENEIEAVNAEMEGDDEIDSEEEELDNGVASEPVKDLEFEIDEDVTLVEEEEEEAEDVSVVSETEVELDSEVFNEIKTDVVDAEIEVGNEVAVKEEEDLALGEEELEDEEASEPEEDSALQVDDDVTLEEEEAGLSVISEIEVEGNSEVVNETEVDIADAESQVGEEVTIEEEQDLAVVEVLDEEETSDSIEDLDLQVDHDATLVEEEEDAVEVELEVSDEIETDGVDTEMNIFDEVTVEEEDLAVGGEELENEEASVPDKGLELYVNHGEKEEEKEEATLVDVDSAGTTDATESTSVDSPRPRRFFKRLWGTRRNIHKSHSDAEVDNEEDQIFEVEETDPENEVLSETDEGITTEASYQPNVLVRLWGTIKEPNEVYSLGITGAKHVSLEGDEESQIISDGDFDAISESDTEDTTEDVMEELEVDISLSIGKRDEGEGSLDVETFDISESSGVEDSEDEMDYSDINGLNEDELENANPEETAAIEETQEDRNVLQLHSPETEGIAQSTIHTRIETKSEHASAEDESTSNSIYRLELRREDCDSLTVEDEDEEKNRSVVTQGISVANAASNADNDSDEAFDDSDSVDDVDGIEEELAVEEEEPQEEDEEGSVIAEIVENTLSEEEEYSIEETYQGGEIEDSVVPEIIEDLLSEEEEDSVKDEYVEEDIEGSVVAEAIEDMSSEEEDYVEDKYVEEDEEGSIVAEAIEGMFSEEEEDSVEEEDQQDVIYEDDSLAYSLEVELENANFVTRLLVNKGLENFVMIAFLVMEWFRVYVVAPFLESIDWIKQGKGQDLLQTVMNTRGGALASSVSDSEDLEEIDDEDNEDDEGTLGKGELTNPDDDESETDRSAESEKEEVESVKTTEVTVESTPTDIPVPTQPRVPPNFIFRRLLNYGLVGHIVIMEMIMASEWLKVYVPQIPTLAGYIFHDILKNKRSASRNREEPVNKRNAGFINIGEGSRLGRKPKKLRKKEDQNALDQLKRIGDVNEAKYRFLSEKFKERHALGPYSATISEVELDLRGIETGLAFNDDQASEEGEAESDSGWILDALEVGEESDEDTALSGSPFDTSVGVSLGSGGPKVSVGLEFTLGKKKKSTKTSKQKLRSVFDNDSMASRNKIKTPKPHVSDFESGVMGRIRAAGANSLVGRSILGAYPGDLPPPDEAASPRGVIGLARRYGYGDWSDDDEDVFGDLIDENDDDDDDDYDAFLDYFSDEEDQPSRKKRSSTSSAKKKKTRKRRSSSREPRNAGVSFEFSSGSPGSSRNSKRSSTITTRRRKSSSSSSSSSSSVTDSISSSARRHKFASSRLPSSPMEKLGGTGRSSTPTAKTMTISKGKRSPKNDLDDVPSLRIQRKRTTRPLRPAGALLEEAERSASSSNEH